MAADTTYQVQRFMMDSGEGRDTDPPERRYTRRGAGEFIGMVFHGQTITHIDAMSHYSWNGLMYNGVPSSRITSREGAQSHSIEAACEGIITRGVLLDLPRLRGVDWLDPTEPVMPEDLEAAEQAQGAKVEQGDILLTRTGNYRMRLERGATGPEGPMTAHQAACAPWFRERGIAMMGPTHPTTYVRTPTRPSAIRCTPSAWSAWGCGSSTTQTWKSWPPPAPRGAGTSSC